MTYQISPTLLDIFLECKRCFYLDVVLNIKRPGGQYFPSLPSGMDKVLKEHFDSFMLKGAMPPEIRDHDHIKDCTLFDDLELLNSWRAKEKGIVYKDPISGVILKGCVDNILKKGDKLIVLDYKTRGYPPKDNTHTYNQSQMDFYNFLLRRNGYKTEDYAFLLYYYPNRVTFSGEVVFDTKLVKIQTDPENANKIFQQAIRVLQEGQIPPKSPHCEFCNYKDKEHQ